MGIVSLSASWSKDLHGNQKASHSPHTHCALTNSVFFHVSVSCWEQESGGITLHLCSHSTGLEGVGVLTPRATGVSLGSHSTVSAVRKKRRVDKEHNKKEASASCQSRTEETHTVHTGVWKWQPGEKHKKLASDMYIYMCVCCVCI